MMDKPSKAEFLEAARTMRDYCFANPTGCTGCPFQKLDECGVQAWDDVLLNESAESVDEPQDAVNHPAHYTHGGVECIDAIEAATGGDGFAGYCAGNVIKYLFRYRFKGGVEDLKKARWYIDRLIEYKGGNGDG